MTRLLVITPIFFALGCAVQLTQEGSAVRLVDDKDGCEFVGTVAGSNAMGVSTAQDAEGAMNDLRNKAAEMGANAIRMINVDSTAESTTALAEALRCPSE